MEEKRSPVRHLHLQLRDLLAERIASPDGDVRGALSDEPKLARELGVSLGTLRKAVALLAVQPPIVRTGQPARTSDWLATALERERLALDIGAEVRRLRRIRRRAGEVVVVDDVVLPAELFPGLSDADDLAGHIGTLARDYGLLLGKCRERISMVQAPPDIAALFEIEQTTQLLMLERVTFLLDGRPAEWRKGYRRSQVGYGLNRLEEVA